MAACVNILGAVRSIYRWKGRVTDDQEQVLLIKTVDGRLDLYGVRLAGRESRLVEPPPKLVGVAVSVGAGVEAALEVLSHAAAVRA